MKRTAIALAFSLFASVLSFSCSEDPASTEVDPDASTQELRDLADFDQDASGDDDALGDLTEPLDAESDSGETEDPAVDADQGEDPIDDPLDVHDSGDEQEDDGGEDDGGEDDCPETAVGYTGVHVLDVNEDPLEVGDLILITIELIADQPSNESGWLWADTSNLNLRPETLERDGVTTTEYTLTGNRLEIPIDVWESAVFTIEGIVVNDFELVTVRTGLALERRDCTVRRSRSGALLQVVGGFYKTSYCLDMVEYRSVMVAPAIRLQNTNNYRVLNGVRADLLADGFIFCPQNPTIVHPTEFCLMRQPGQSVTLAGSYRADGSWEVDDFMLIEVFENGLLHADGFTSQSHPGGSTFWCPDTSSLVCQDGCTAELIVVADGRQIEAIAVASAVGPNPRQHVDGAVAIDSLLPETSEPIDVRVTALDQGVEGTLQPAIYLISAEP